MEAPWAKATLKARRDGWGAVAAVTVEDSLDDGVCVYASVTLIVTGGLGAEQETSEACGPGARTSEQVDLRPGYEGTSIETIELRVRRSRSLLPDPGVFTTVRLPQMTPIIGGREAADTADLMTRPIAGFEAARVDEPRPWNWTSDGCSVPGFFPEVVVGSFKDLFVEACHRHDFGYRNYGRRFIDPTDERRAWIDEIFRSDMQSACGGVTALEQPPCRQAAEAFYLAVRNFGGRAFYGP